MKSTELQSQRQVQPAGQDEQRRAVVFAKRRRCGTRTRRNQTSRQESRESFHQNVKSVELLRSAVRSGFLSIRSNVTEPQNEGAKDSF